MKIYPLRLVVGLSISFLIAGQMLANYAAGVVVYSAKGQIFAGVFALFMVFWAFGLWFQPDPDEIDAAGDDIMKRISAELVPKWARAKSGFLGGDSELDHRMEERRARVEAARQKLTQKKQQDE